MRRYINRIKITLHTILKKLKLQNHLKLFSFKSIIEKNFKLDSDFSFIQVGANDGISYDELYYIVKERKSKGLVIEPLKDYYDKLVKNYAFNPDVIPVQMAVHSNLNIVKLYRINKAFENQFPEWSGGIGSLFKDHHKRSGLPSNAIIEEDAPADRLMNIIEKNSSLNSLDLLQIDVEGYDLEVLKQVDFTRIKPLIIKYEYINLSKEDRILSTHLLKQNGYYYFYEDTDIIGVLEEKISL